MDENPYIKYSQTFLGQTRIGRTDLKVNFLIFLS